MHRWNPFQPLCWSSENGRKQGVHSQGLRRGKWSCVEKIIKPTTPNLQTLPIFHPPQRTIRPNAPARPHRGLTSNHLTIHSASRRFTRPIGRADATLSPKPRGLFFMLWMNYIDVAVSITSVFEMMAPRPRGVTRSPSGTRSTRHSPRFSIAWSAGVLKGRSVWVPRWSVWPGNRAVEAGGVWLR